MWRHDIHTIGKCGHKRNFTVYKGTKKDLKFINAYCMICSGAEEDDNLVPMKFDVIRYLEEVREVEDDDR